MGSTTTIPTEISLNHHLLSPVSDINMNGHEKNDSHLEDHQHHMSSTAYPEPPPPLHAHSPRSIASESEILKDNSEFLSPLSRSTSTFKRLDDPQRNGTGKMVCTYWTSEEHPECQKLTFERRCEWSKHMDKHDRPYKCAHLGCEKLLGFTYSGGLLRHEREVHRMHGGSKKPLYCPHGDCKRSSGRGFTRKENLAEHIRRVHRSAGDEDPGVVAAAVAAAANSAQESSEFNVGQINDSPDGMSEHRIEALAAPVAVMDPTLNGDDSLKRKRSTLDAASIENEEVPLGSDDLRAEIKRLRLSNLEKDDRLKKLEETVSRLQVAVNDSHPMISSSLS